MSSVSIIELQVRANGGKRSKWHARTVLEIGRLRIYKVYNRTIAYDQWLYIQINWTRAAPSSKKMDTLDEHTPSISGKHAIVFSLQLQREATYIECALWTKLCHGATGWLIWLNDGPILPAVYIRAPCTNAKMIQNPRQHISLPRS